MKTRLCLFVGVLLLLLTGCALLHPPPDPLRFVLEARGEAWGTSIMIRPSVDEGGLTVGIATTEPCWVDWGDGSEPVFMDTTRASYTYRYEGHYTVVVYVGERSVSGMVTVQNRHPILYGPFVPQATEDWGLEWGELATFDFREQYRGCSASGSPLVHYGMSDPDGDPIYIRLTIAGPDAHGEIVEYSVYTQLGTYVTGSFVEAELLYPWIGWTAVEPLAPVFPRGPGCGWLSVAEPERCGDPDPTIPPPGPEHFHALTYTVDLVDSWMREEDAVTATWNGYLSSSPTCN